MPTPELTYASFLLRLWRDPGKGPVSEDEPVWLGEIEAIQTGRTWQFVGTEALLELLAEQLADHPGPVE